MTRYDIPFATREEFEAAWPHLLEVKQPGMPIVLYRGPHHDLGTMSAGVQIQQPLDDSREDAATTIRKQSADERLARTGFLALIVDGDMSVRESHVICDRIEEALKAEIPSVRITIHVEPDDEAKLPPGTSAVPFA